MTEPTQAPPAHASTTRGAPAAPSRGVPDQFGNALAQALASPEPAAAGTPASPASAKAMKGQPPAKGQASAKMAPPLPLPEAAAPLEATPPTAPSKTVKNGPAAPAADAKAGEPSAEAVKSSDGPQPSAPSQPILPVPPQAMPPQVLAIIAQPAASTSEADDAAPSTGQESSGTAAVGASGHGTPSASVPVAAQAAAPSASAPPSRAAAAADASDTVAHAMQKHLSAAMAEEEPPAMTPAIPADAAPLPTAALAVPPNAAPAPVSAAPHPAPSPSQEAPPRPSTAGEPAPPSAAVQVGPVLASFAAGAAHPGAPQHLTIRLDPMDLGRVQVRIERSPDGSARVDLKVEKPDTLLLLLRDQPQLHRALDLAGVPSTERTLQFHLAPSDAAAPGAMAAQSNADGGRGQHRPGQPQSGRFAANGVPSLGEPIPGPAGFRRAGVDITA